MTNTSLILSLSANIPDTRLAKLTRDLERDLSRAGIHVGSVDSPPTFGEKGEPITLGVLALSLITSGAVTAIIECLKIYLSRERGLTIKLTHPDGTQAEVTTRNVDTSNVREILEAAVLTRG
jgi:hypothetical protein